MTVRAIKVKGEQLSFLAHADSAEQLVTGALTGETGGEYSNVKPLYIKGTYLHWIDMAGNERRKEGTLTGESRTKGNITVHGTYLYYGDDDGDERSLSVVTSPETLRPNGVGATTDISNVSGAATHWEAVDEVVADDGDSYVYQVATATKLDTYALPASEGSGTITSVTAYARLRDAWHPTTNNTARVAIRTGGIDYFGATITIPRDGSWNTYSKAWATNPNTGNAWTWAEIDALECGVELNRIVASPACTQCYVEVAFS